MQEQSSYEVLSSINVNNLVKSKNGFNYLSWANAVDALLKKYPTASWDNREWDGLPYLKTETGCYVEVTVTIESVTRTQLHPVLDYRNKPILKPDAYQINTSLQRALAKCVALHGLGLYIFQGEDLPLSETEAITDARMELSMLLEKANKLSAESKRAIMNMSYDQIIEKIEEYK